MNITTRPGSEDGAIMIVSVVILALLTIIGIAVTTTSSVELQIAGNEKAHMENFYLAEGAAMMLAQILENQADLEDGSFPDPGQGEDVDIPVKDRDNDLDLDNHSILEDTYWEGSDDKSCEAPGLATENPPNPRFIARKMGLARGSSLNQAAGSMVYDYCIFARRKKNNSVVVIEMGYRKRF